MVGHVQSRQPGEVLDHAPNHELLLVVFLAETGEIGTDDLEQFEHDCGHAAKVAWAACAFEDAGELGHLDERRSGAVRVHRLTRGGEDDGGARAVADFRSSVERSG